MGEREDPVPIVTRRVHVRVRGIVQGVGFRPYVHNLATDLGLSGFVGNDNAGVFMEVEGAARSVGVFLERMALQPPPLAVIEEIDTRDVAPVGGDGFEVVTSEPTGARQVDISPDVATCDACLAEIQDPRDRRHGYPFTNCTNCGPRYTIVRDVPYDRARTTMSAFELCDRCEREYHDPADRRFHAQPTCCPACGPRLELVGVERVGADPIGATAALLRDGRIVAVKGLGGYHLAADASHRHAAALLRERKHREDKPFALMVRDVEAARTMAELSREEAELLSSPAAPIVLLRRHPDAPVAEAVAPGNRWLGLMLPYTPMHHLLLHEHGGPIVLTSGNVSDEPIAYRDEDAFQRLDGVADAFLTHDRPIHTRVDDSVVRMVGGRRQPVRRSRGYVPAPLRLDPPARRATLGVGAELKNTICLAEGGRAIVSHHIGDLENYETFASFLEAIEHLGRLFDIEPDVVAHDLHPEYLATKHALELTGVELVGVQHHHAHIAACLADNGERGPVIGVAFDGTGYGADGTIWGGEVLVADLARFERAGSFEEVPLPGGAAAIREPWRMAAAYLGSVYGDDLPDGLDVRERNSDRWDDVVAVARAGVNSPPTSSAGRLFDAVAALIGVRDTVNYEGQAAIELEQRASPSETGTYEASVIDRAPFRIRGTDLVRAVCEDLRAGTPVPTIAGRFHNAMVDVIVAACRRVRRDSGLTAVALSGGVFQNAVLVGRTVAELEADGFRVLTHQHVPPNDGGISFGQVAVAAARQR